MTQEYEASKPEYREIESLEFAEKIACSGGFFKVQLIQQDGIVVWESK